MKRNFKILIWVLAYFLIFISLYFIFVPAYISTQIACKPQLTQSYADKGIVVAGSFNANRTDGSYQIVYNDEIENVETGTVRHENCHLAQFQENRLEASCSFPRIINRFGNEVEAYLSQYLHIRC